MAKSKARKGVKEKMAKANKVKADAKKLQEYRMKKYQTELLEELIQEQIKLDKDKTSGGSIEDVLNTQTVTDEANI